MPKTLSRPSQLYQPGVYGPFSVDQITNANTAALEWSASIENWPTDPTTLLLKARLLWDSGGGATWWIFGGRKNRDGTPATEIRERVYVPVELDDTGNIRKGNVAGGSMQIEVFVPLRSAITFAGVA